MNFKLTLTAAAAMIAMTGTAYAQSQATQSTTGSTRILQAISISKQADLDFGRIVRPSSGSSTIQLTAGGVRSVTSGNAALANGGTVSAAAYTVTGEGGQSFSITPDATFNMVNGANSIEVTPTASAATGALSGSIGSSGTANFTVGGSFTITNTTVTGDYSGSFNVVVAYN
jgi:hypothetical protein